MRRILLDANLPIGVRVALPDYEVVTAFEMGWNGLVNGELILAAEAHGFDLLITADQNLEYQQNLADHRLGLLVLGTNHWPTLQAHLSAIALAVGGAEAGGYAYVAFERPPLRRRPPPSGR